MSSGIGAGVGSGKQYKFPERDYRSTFPFLMVQMIRYRRKANIRREDFHLTKYLCLQLS